MKNKYTFIVLPKVQNCVLVAILCFSGNLVIRVTSSNKSSNIFGAGIAAVALINGPHLLSGKVDHCG